MDILLSYSFASFGTFCIGYIFYWRSFIWGTGEPSRVTWFVWAILDTIALIGMVQRNADYGLIAGATVGSWATFLLTLRYGKSTWDRYDVFCLMGSGVSILLMAYTDVTWGILMSQVAMVIGSFPTFRIAWNEPEKEDRIAWLCYFIACIIGLFAVKQWTIDDAAQPIAFTLTETIMMYLVWVRPWINAPPERHPTSMAIVSDPD